MSVRRVVSSRSAPVPKPKRAAKRARASTSAGALGAGALGADHPGAEVSGPESSGPESSGGEASPPEVSSGEAKRRGRGDAARAGGAKPSATSTAGGRAKGAASSTSPLGARAASVALAANGSAVDAVVAAFFTEAGNDPDVLFGPVSALVFGGGAGVRAFDGRPLQPGLGAVRPRGSKDGEHVEDAARVAVPRSVQTAILLHTMYGRTGLTATTRQGAADAKARGATLRAELLTEIGRAGGAALAKASVVDALLAAGGRAAGGALTATDLRDARPGDIALTPAASFDGAKVYRAPWGSQVGAATAAIRGATEVIVACDPWGLVAVLSFGRAPGLSVPELELSLPLYGVAVRRGVPRTTPATPLPAPAPMVVVDRGADLRVAFGARVDVHSKHRVLTPADVEAIATTTPVDAGVRAVAKALATSVAVIALEARGARGVAVSEPAR